MLAKHRNRRRLYLSLVEWKWVEISRKNASLKPLSVDDPVQSDPLFWMAPEKFVEKVPAFLAYQRS